MIEALLQKGTGAVIGTLWPVGDCSAAKFSTAFYRFLFDCQLHVENAMLLVRRMYFHSEHSVDIAAYVLYTCEEGVQTIRKRWLVDD